MTTGNQTEPGTEREGGITMQLTVRLPAGKLMSQAEAAVREHLKSEVVIKDIDRAVQKHLDSLRYHQQGDLHPQIRRAVAIVTEKAIIKKLGTAEMAKEFADLASAYVFSPRFLVEIERETDKMFRASGVVEKALGCPEVVERVEQVIRDHIRSEEFPVGVRKRVYSTVSSIIAYIQRSLWEKVNG